EAAERDRRIDHQRLRAIVLADAEADEAAIEQKPGLHIPAHSLDFLITIRRLLAKLANRRAQQQRTIRRDRRPRDAVERDANLARIGVRRDEQIVFQRAVALVVAGVDAGIDLLGFERDK